MAEGTQARDDGSVLVAGDLGQDRARAGVNSLLGEGDQCVAIGIDAEFDDQLDPRLGGRRREGCFRFQDDSATVVSHV